MAKYIRYVLATACFAASAGCLALWCVTILGELRLNVTYISTSLNLQLHAADGIGNIQRSRSRFGDSVFGECRFGSCTFRGRASQLYWTGGQQDAFGRTRTGVFIPLWYPSLIFALVGVGILRFRRQFSIRSALIAITVVAALIGMAVTL